MLKSNYIGPSIDLARNNVQVVFGQGVPEGGSTSQTTQHRINSILDGDAGGPGELVSRHFSDVLFEGKELNRGLKRKAGNTPLTIMHSSGIAFAKRNKEGMVDKVLQKKRAAESQDINIRSVPARSATVEERLRASRLQTDKRNHRWRGFKRLPKN